MLQAEEERFGETLENGMKILGAALDALAKSGGKVLDGETAFTLYDTFGFPLDLTADVARERGVVGRRGRRSTRRWTRSASARARRRQFKMGAQLDYDGPKTRVPRLRHAVGGRPRRRAVPRRRAGRRRSRRASSGIVVLDRTPFYAESGGQVGDRGELTKGGACLTLFAVNDTQKIQPDVFGHIGEVKTGELQGRRHRRRAGRPRRRAAARCATTRPRT